MQILVEGKTSTTPAAEVSAWQSWRSTKAQNGTMHGQKNHPTHGSDMLEKTISRGRLQYAERKQENSEIKLTNELGILHNLHANIM